MKFLFNSSSKAQGGEVMIRTSGSGMFHVVIIKGCKLCGVFHGRAVVCLNAREGLRGL